MGVPAFTPRHPRLGCGGNTSFGRRRFQWRAAQNADADFAERLFLRAGSHQRQVAPYCALWPGELGNWNRRTRAPHPDPEKEPARDGRLLAPDEGGLTNYRSPSFDPKTGLFIVDAHPSYSIYFAKPDDGDLWLGGCRL